MREGWEAKSWGEVLEIRSGRNQKEVLNPNGKYPILGSAGKIMGYADDYICEAGTTIVGRKGTINNPLFINEKFWNVDTAFGLHSLEELDRYYLHYFCLNTDFTELDKGSGRPSLVKKDLLQISIPIPPLTEQQQIVEILDQAFEAIDQAKANIEKNIENAKELFQSKLNDIFSQKGEGWEEKTLKQMSKIMYGYTSKVVENGNVQYVRITDIQDGNVNWNTVPFVNISEEEKPKYQLTKGDIVFARTGATTGKSYLMENPPNSVFASYLIRVQCDSSILLPSFLYLFFQSGIYWQIVELGTSGSAQGGFNASKLGAMKIHFPKDKNQQLEYVNLIESIRMPIDEMIMNYQIKLNDLEELKKSILQKAFAGELTNKTVGV